MENIKLIGFGIALLILFYMVFIKYRPVQDQEIQEEFKAAENSDELLLDVYYLGKYCIDMDITIEDLQNIKKPISTVEENRS